MARRISVFRGGSTRSLPAQSGAGFCLRVVCPVIRILNNHYVIQTPNPGQIRAVFPQAKVAEVRGQWFCAVPYTLEAARVLNNLGFQAPGPIRTEYAFEGRFTPMAHQLHTADFLALNPRAYVLSGMGTAIGVLS